MIEVEAPRLAPFIQEGSLFDEESDGDGARLLRAAERAEVDTLILGCTHYPLVAPMLQRILGRDVRLVSGGHAVAAAVQRTLERAGLARDERRGGRLRLPLHRPVSSFRDVATRFLQMPLGEVELLEIPLPEPVCLSKQSTLDAGCSAGCG